MDSTPAVVLEGITKRFPGVVANDDVSLRFMAGEIHVLLGENGAGKSTLMGILSGMLQPDGGTIRIDGRETRIASPGDSLALGIGTVFQHVLLVPSLTVLENLMLGGPWWARQDRSAALARFTELRDLLAVTIEPDDEVAQLSLGQQQQVEIMRALWRDESVLILDEPTSMLTPQGVRELGLVMRRLRDNGVAIIFITHKLKEAYELGDRISVLRLGRLVGRIDKDRLGELSEHAATEEIVAMMFAGAGGAVSHDREATTLTGEVLKERRQHQVDRAAPPILRVEGLSTSAQVGACPLRAAGFEVWPGEVFGIAGVDGNGQKHLAEVLAGQRSPESGRIAFAGEDVTGLSVSGRRARGIRYTTDERLGEGTVGHLSVAINLVMKEIGEPPFWNRGVSNWETIFGHAREKIAAHDIRTPSERSPVGRLSGGNIQKTLLARELGDGTRLAIFNKPTYGLDLHNTRLARDRIVQAADAGVAVVVISTELDELLEVADRIGVLYQGALQGIVENRAGAEEEIGRLMIGSAAA